MSQLQASPDQRREETASSADAVDPDIKPRSPRRGRRPVEDLGLPPDEELVRFATAYLKMQMEHWPNLVGAVLPGSTTPDVIEAMVNDFKERHRGHKPEIEKLTALAERLPLGSVYPRYSDDNSNPRSIIDQVREMLRRAKGEGVFVPWSFVYGDYARSAVHGIRPGFESLMKFLKTKKNPPSILYIHEFQRGMRDENDAWRLAGTCKKMKIRLVSLDGFHLDDDDWDTKVQFYNLITSMETKYKRHRVQRGMKGAAAENSILGKIPMGYTKRVVRRPSGEIELTSRDGPAYERCIDRTTAEWVVKAARWVLMERWPRYRVAVEFNKHKVDGWDGWSTTSITGMLINPAYIGLFIWNRTSSEYDREERSWVRLPTRWTEWAWYHDRKLAILPKSWHVALRKKFEKELPRRERKQKQRENRAALTLFSYSLICPHCKRLLILVHSDDKYKSLCCPNGKAKHFGCPLTSSKSARIIEQSLLRFFREHLFTPAVLSRLMRDANAWLETESQRPKEDTTADRTEARRLEAAVAKLLKRVENTDDEHLCDVYERRLKQHAADLAAVKDRIRAKEAMNAPLPPKLDLTRVEEHLKNLREVLQQHVQAAATAIEKLTGPIMISQERVPGRSRARWIATFSPNLMKLLAYVSQQKNCPEWVTLELLSSRKWTMGEFRVPLEDTPWYAELVPQIEVGLKEHGSIEAVAAHMAMTSGMVEKILAFGRTGARPQSLNPRKLGKTTNRHRYILIADEVVHLKREHRWTWGQIAEHLTRKRGEKIGPKLVKRAWKYGTRDEPETGDNKRYSRLGEEKMTLMRELIRQRVTVKEITRRVGCGRSSVFAEKRQ